MKMEAGMNVRYFPLLLCVLLPSLLFAQLPNEDSKTDASLSSTLFSSLYLRGSGSAQFSSWTPGMKQKADDQIIDIQTEGLQAYSFHGEFGSRGLDKGFYRILSYSQEGPFESSENQDEIYRTNVTQTAGIEKIVGEIDIYGILKLLKISNHLSFLGLRYTYTEELFFGTGTVLSPLAYMAKGSEIVYDPENDRSFILGATPLKPDDDISFKTTFVDQEYSIPLFQYSRGAFRKTVRAGIYQSVWEKPSNNSKDININVIDWFEMEYVTNLPVVFDSGYKTMGIVLGVEDNSPHLPGFHSSYKVRYGLQNEMELASGIDEAYNVERVSAYSLLYDGWYRIAFGSGRSSANMTLGFCLDYRSFGKTYERTETVKTADRDILLKVYTSFAFILQK